MNHTVAIQIRINDRLSGTVGTLSTPVDSVEKTISLEMTNGVGAGQSNNRYAAERTLAGGANENLDLSGGLTNGLGSAIAATKLKGIFLYAPESNTAALTVSRPAANGVPFLSAVSAGFDLVPGGAFLIWNPSLAGIGIVAGTADLINVSNASGDPLDYWVIFELITP